MRRSARAKLESAISRLFIVDILPELNYNDTMTDSGTGHKKGRGVEFDDALKGYSRDHDAVLPDEVTDYKSLTASSVGSLILGVLSALIFIDMMFVIFPLMGIVLGVMAVRTILKATTELEGLGIASAGVGLCATLLVAGSVYHAYQARHADPFGYVRIEWSDLLADPRTGRIPDNILRLAPHLDEQGNLQPATPILIEGYMHYTTHQTGLRSFMLIHARRGPFCPPTPNPSQMIDVTLSGDLRVSYRTGRIRVGGTLTVNPDPAPGTTPYSLRADVLR